MDRTRQHELANELFVLTGMVVQVKRFSQALQAVVIPALDAEIALVRDQMRVESTNKT